MTRCFWTWGSCHTASRVHHLARTVRLYSVVVHDILQRCEFYSFYPKKEYLGVLQMLGYPRIPSIGVEALLLLLLKRKYMLAFSQKTFVMFMIKRRQRLALQRCDRSWF